MKIKTLIVEKNNEYALDLETILGSVTKDIGSVSSLKDVEGFCKEYEFDVLFVDMELWRAENKQELNKLIERISPEVRIVLTSKSSNNAILKEAMDKGVYGCIHKPFDRTETLFMAGHYKKDPKNETLYVS